MLAKALPRPCPTCGEISGGVFCPADGAPLAGSFTIADERYVVDELIGQGATSIVFGGNHRTLSRPVAVKVLRPEVARDEEAQQRFLREARSASRLSHENVVGVLDFGWDDDLGVTYLVMERVHAESLAAELSQRGRVPWREASQLLAQVSRGVAAAHALGIVHRDLSPRNVLLVEVGGRRVAKLCDFGLSRRVDGGDRVTSQGAWVGTPSYMAPEQVEHATSDAVEPAVDVYAIGVIAYEMLTGHLPVVGASATEVLAVKAGEEPSLGFSAELGLPDELSALIGRCLSRSPSARPTAAELERALVRLDARATSMGALGSLPGIAISRTLTPALPPLEDGSPSMIGSYRVVRSLGAGGTGRVYLGEHPVIGTKVAIKVLLPEIAGSQETVERFIQEARSSSQIDSPHIPRYYDFGRTAGGLPYAVMEYFEGQTLAEHIEKGGALSVEETAGILYQVAGALSLAHKAGLVHRDLKPENLFLVAAEPRAAAAEGAPSAPESQFSVKVLDFGIAKSFDKQSGAKTQQGFFLGTPFYCAPEQVFGAEVDPRADVYALGVTAFEMLTGMPPFVGEVSEVLEAKTSRDAPPLRAERPELPERVERTVACMLARELPQRAESMSWVREQVERWLRPEAEDSASRRLPRAASVVSVRAPTRRPVVELEVEDGRAGALVGASMVDGAATHQRAPSSAGLPPRAASSTPAGLDSLQARRGASAPAVDFDALETITLDAKDRSFIQVALPPPPRSAPLWRRPLALVGGGLVLVAMAIAGVMMGRGHGAAARAPTITPLDSTGAAAHAPAQPAVPPPSAPPSTDVAPAPVAHTGGEPPPATEPATAGDGPESSDEVLDEASSERPSGRRNGRSGRKKRGQGGNAQPAAGKSTPPVEPSPPNDVKLVDPFQN